MVTPRIKRARRAKATVTRAAVRTEFKSFSPQRHRITEKILIEKAHVVGFIGVFMFDF
jgi:hypothetical protein